MQRIRYKSFINQLFTYLPVRLQCLMSEVGSGIVIELLDNIEPDNLKHFLAITGSYMENELLGWCLHCLYTNEEHRMCYTSWRCQQKDAANQRLSPLFYKFKLQR